MSTPYDQLTGRPSDASNCPRVMRLPEVLHWCGISRSTLYEMAARGDFPPPVRISTRIVGWLSTDIEYWIRSRPLASDPPQLHGPYDGAA